MTMQNRLRAVLLVATVGVLVAALALGTRAYEPAAAPAPLARQEAAGPVASDPARPCTRSAATAAPSPAPTPPPTDVAASFDPAAGTVVLTAGTAVTLPALAQAIGDPAVLREEAPGEWLLGAELAVLGPASLQIAAPTVRWLKLAGVPGRPATIKAYGGGIDITGTCVTSWDPAQNRADTELTDGRGFLLARDGARMGIDDAELRYLGYAEVESYGLSWRNEGTTGGITRSVVSHNYFGAYSYQVGGLVIADNEFHDNVLYGIDPHTGSHNLTIENNRVHDNGKHGIILAEDCTDSVIRGNTVYRNAHHGIVLYLRSDRNVIENNDTYANAAQGINVNESNNNVVRGNRAYDNTESGIAVTQTAEHNLVEGNQSRGNQQDGIRVVTEAAATVIRGNTIGENRRYGVYVDVDDVVDVVDNTIFGNRAGIMLKGTPSAPDGNRLFDNRDADVLSG